jgi:hypothetical protein
MKTYTHADAEAQAEALEMLPDISGRAAENVTTCVTKLASVPDKKEQRES